MVFLSWGAIHIHSTHSDGTGTIEEIAKAAKKVGLHWIIVTDHNNMDGKEGIYEGVYVIIGEEISPDFANHYIALGIKEPISFGMPPIEYIQKVKEQGGFGFIAHPDENLFRKNPYQTSPWKDWSIQDFGGIEIWNYMSNWVDNYNDRNPFKILKSLLFRNNISGPTKKTLRWWDDLNSKTQQIIPAIGGIDAHAFDIKKLFVTVKIFPYRITFETITNFIYLENPLSEDFESSKKAILKAIKSGKNLIINRGSKWFKTPDSMFYIQNSTKKAYAGEYIDLDDHSKIIIKLPAKATIKLIHDGKVVLQKEASKLELEKFDKGKYRFEAYYKNKPWIFSNPILVQ